MAFVACGINHKTAPLTIRETMVRNSDQQKKALLDLLDPFSLQEAMLLQTCNRTELYCETLEPQQLMSQFAHIHGMDVMSIENSFYQHENDEAVQHALRVACGIDSMMVGEPQILGQMKQAFMQAEQLGSIKRQLRLIFSYVFSATKRIRHRSGIGHNAVSVASAAVRLVSQLFHAMHELRVFIIGSGETAALVVKYLQQQGVKHFSVTNRTAEAAQQLAEKIQGVPIPISEIANHLPYTDVVIAATACPVPFINKMMVEQALTQRAFAPMFLLDLSVPRNIEADVAQLDAVRLFNIDDLHQTIQHGLRERQTAAVNAEKLIEDELSNYTRWSRSLRANPIICNYRSQMQELAEQELQRARRKLSSGQPQHDVLDELCQRLVNKLTHAPTLSLRHAASTHHETWWDEAQLLFNEAMDPLSYEEIT